MPKARAVSAPAVIVTLGAFGFRGLVVHATLNCPPKSLRNFLLRLRPKIRNLQTYPQECQ